VRHGHDLEPFDPLEVGLGLLEQRLPRGALGGVARDERADRELGERDRGDQRSAGSTEASVSRPRMISVLVSSTPRAFKAARHWITA
jgi:hypothetical protein